MSEQPSQTRENHVRLHPPFHFFFAPAILFLIVVALIELIRHPGLLSAAQLILVLVVADVGFLARAYALKVQDRMIRLEERLRLSSLVDQPLLSAGYGLSERQLIALRFASDNEFVTLAERARAEGLDPKAIKALITRWRPDHWRV